MAGRLDGKVVVVTGGGNGLGQASCVRFAEEGAQVVVADLQEQQAAETVSQVQAVGGEAVFARVDVTSWSDNEAMAQTAIDSFGRIDCVVTAAGISHANYDSGDIEADLKAMGGRLEYLERPGWDFVETSVEEWDKVLAVNTTGTLMSMQACVQRMLDAGHGGSIVTIASIAAKNPDAGPLPYTVSKAGVWMLTKKAARMLAPAGIRVNSIGPGFIETNMTAVIDLLPREENEPDFWAQLPMGRRGVPLEIANTALFLLSDESSYFTGEILHPDGGYFTE